LSIDDVRISALTPTSQGNSAYPNTTAIYNVVILTEKSGVSKNAGVKGIFLRDENDI